MLSPLERTGGGDVDAIRDDHLQRVNEIVIDHSLSEMSPVAAQLYWTLYLGLLSYWTADRSPKQENSLALLDQSISMFCDWLCNAGGDQTPAE